MPSPLPIQAGEGITLREIFAMLRRRLRLIAVVAALGTGLAALAAHWKTPEYTATAALLIDPLDGQVLETAGPADTRLQGGPGVIENQIALMTSRSHLEPVMRELGLLGPAAISQPAATSEPRVDLGDAAGGIELPGPLGRLAMSLPESWLVAAGLAQDVDPTDAPPMAEPEAAGQAAIERFRRKLEVGRAGQSLMITVRYTATDPDRAAQVANAVAYAYVDAQLERRRQAAERAAGWLQERLEELRETVRSSDEAAADFRIAHGLAGPADRTLNHQMLFAHNQQLNTLRAERVAKEAKLRRARQIRAEERDLDGLADTIGSPLIATLRVQEAALRRERAELVQTYGDRHPRMVNLRAQIAEIRAKIREEIDRSIRNLEDELAVLVTRERALVADLREIERGQERNQQVEVRLAELERRPRRTASTTKRCSVGRKRPRSRRRRCCRRRR